MCAGVCSDLEKNSSCAMFVPSFCCDVSTAETVSRHDGQILKELSANKAQEDVTAIKNIKKISLPS